MYWLIGVFLFLAFAYLVVRLWAEISALKRLEANIRNAREGLLEPAAIGRLGWTCAGRAISEYNATISTLRWMFKNVEDCQSRFHNEYTRSSTILQSLPGALLSLDEELHVTIANQQAESLFGAETEKLIGANLFELLNLNERDRELLRDAFLYKYRIRNQDISLNILGKTRFFSLNLGFYNDKEYDMGGVLILQDITEYRELMESLAMSEKLVVMGQLAGGVAHELNTPLGNILGYAQLVERGASALPALSGYARVISEEAQRCSRVIQDLLRYARHEQCTDNTCDINQLTVELIDAFLTCRLKRYLIEVQMNLSPGRLVAEGSGGQLEIVLTNLLNNSIQALDNVPDPRIVIESRFEAPYAILSVTDNGPGVPPDIRNRVFDPFYTTKPVGQGTGLGLSISNAIVAKQGGFIVYDGDYSDGARFVIKLLAVDMNRVRQ